MDIERKWNSESGNQPSKLLTNRKQGNLDSEKLHVMFPYTQLLYVLESWQLIFRKVLKPDQLKSMTFQKSRIPQKQVKAI